jgi:hypothetical protein
VSRSGASPAIRPPNSPPFRLLYLPTLQSWIDLASNPAAIHRRLRLPGLPGMDVFTLRTATGITEHMEFGTADGSFPLEFPIPDVGQPLGDLLSLSFPDLNNDGIPDIAAQVGNTVLTALVSLPLNIPFLTVGPTITLPANTVFSAFDSTADITGDGLPDLLGASTTGQVSSFVASRDLLGNTNYTYDPARVFYGFPTADGSDGKFNVVVGANLLAYARAVMKYYIEVPDNQTQVKVDVFDGDLGGLNDIGTGNTCFRLFEAAHKEESGGTLVKSVSSATLADSAWTSLVSAPVTADPVRGLRRAGAAAHRQRRATAGRLGVAAEPGRLLSRGARDQGGLRGQQPADGGDDRRRRPERAEQPKHGV